MTIDRGIVAALAAATLFGLSTPLAKMLVGELSPLMLAGLLYLGSGVGLALVLGTRRMTGAARPISLPRGAAAWPLGGAILFGGMLAPYLLMFGLQSTDAASASLILNLEGVLTALLAWFVFDENFDRRIALGMVLIVAGGIALSIQSVLAPGGALGVLAIAAACLAWAIDNNLTRKVSGFDAMPIACAKGLVAGSCNLALAWLSGGTRPTAGAALAAGVLGFVGYGASLTLFVMALRRLGTARTGAYFSVAPFVGAMLAVAMGAPVTVLLGVSAALMAAGLWLHLTERHVHRHRHDAAAPEHFHAHDVHHEHLHDPPVSPQATHSHPHEHAPTEHVHPHFPDVDHRHKH